jgi:ADP-ribosyl-[dinitrogen reductase] hydrolase
LQRTRYNMPMHRDTSRAPRSPSSHGRERMTVNERVAGGLLGVAVGDALGATLEFGPPRPPGLEHTEITGGGPFGWRPGEPTDDTDLTIAVAEAYAGGFSVGAVADRFLAWYARGPRDVGGTTASALRIYRATGNPHTSGRGDDRSAANGSLMRTIAVGLARPDAHTRRHEAAAVSAITHAEPRCLAACVAYCDIVDALVRGVDPDQALEATIAAGRRSGMLPQVLEVLERAPTLSAGQLDTSGYVLGTLGIGVWALTRPVGFEAALTAVVNLGGDADTTGAVAGGLLGVRNGSGGIPERWTTAVLAGPRMRQLAGHLTALRRSGEGA